MRRRWREDECPVGREAQGCPHRGEDSRFHARSEASGGRLADSSSIAGLQPPDRATRFLRGSRSPRHFVGATPAGSSPGDCGLLWPQPPARGRSGNDPEGLQGLGLSPETPQLLPLPRAAPRCHRRLGGHPPGDEARGRGGPCRPAPDARQLSERPHAARATSVSRTAAASLHRDPRPNADPSVTANKMAAVCGVFLHGSRWPRQQASAAENEERTMRQAERRPTHSCVQQTGVSTCHVPGTAPGARHTGEQMDRDASACMVTPTYVISK